MKEIQTFALARIANAAHFLFVSNVADRAEKDAAVSEKCAEQVKALREAVKAEDENLQLSAKSLITDKIADADKERDRLYAGYKKAVGGYEGFPDAAMAEAAKIMKRSTANRACLLLAAALAGCASVPRTKSGADVGTYLDNPAAYIAYRGYGASREAAESSARAQISRYFSMSIHVMTAERALVSDGASSSEITEETFVESQTELFAVHYTAPVFSKERGTYELVAYIDRAEAWGMYEPKLRQRAGEYSAWFEQARTETTPFLRVLRSYQALSCAERNSLDAMLQFAAALYPDGAALYEQTRNGLAALPAAAARYAAQCPMLIKSESAVVRDAVAAALGKARFVVTDDVAKATVRCAVDVTENRQELEAGTFYTPSVRLVFSEALADGGKPLFSYEASLERTGARNPQVAQQRAYAKVANHIQDSLLSALEAVK